MIENHKPPRGLVAAEIAGLTLGTLTLLFFMTISGLSLFDRTIPCESRFLVVVVLALGSAMSTGFIGGTAAAKGQIRLPGQVGKPLQFAVGGGIAVLIIVLVVGWKLYASGCGVAVNAYRVNEVDDSVDLSRWDAKESRIAKYGEGVTRLVRLSVVRLQANAGPFQTRVGYAGRENSFVCSVTSGEGDCEPDAKQPNPYLKIYDVNIPEREFPLHQSKTVEYREDYLDPLSFAFPLNPAVLSAGCIACDVSYRIPYQTTVYRTHFILPLRYKTVWMKEVVTPPDSVSGYFAPDQNHVIPPESFDPPPLNNLARMTSVQFRIAFCCE